MPRWLLVRHGETDWNLQARAQGQIDTPLNDKGKAQAERIASRLSSETFAAAYSSDLSRVVETARPVMRGRDVPIAYTEELREKHFGDWEGMTFEEIRAKHPRGFGRMFSDDSDFAAPGGGETDRDLCARAAAFAERIRAAHPDDDLLIAAHGGSLRALIASLIGIPPSRMWRLRLDNASLSVLTFFDDGNAVLTLLNDTNHMREER